jgi:hypothetical protein
MYSVIELVFDPATDVKSTEKTVRIVNAQFHTSKEQPMSKPRAFSRALSGDGAYREDP